MGEVTGLRPETDWWAYGPFSVDSALLRLR